MKRIKVNSNENIHSFKFTTKLLESDKLFELCNALNLSDIYIDIFGVDNRKRDFSKKLSERNEALIISSIDKSGGVSIKANVNDIPSIIETLAEFDFGDLNVWDMYTDWEQYLKEKADNTPPAADSESKVYLNYNPIEGNKVELYIAPTYVAESIRQRIADLIF